MSRDPTGHTLWVVGVDGVDHSLLETVADAAASVAAVDARVHPENVPSAGFDDGEPAYHGLNLARYARRRTGRRFVLAVTDAPIAKPGGDPAFGLATKGGVVAAVSTARLGDPEADAVTDRFRRVVAQHVGYLLGLGACGTEGCLLRVADEVEDLDGIGPDPCAECETELRVSDSPLRPDGDESLAVAGADAIALAEGSRGLDGATRLFVRGVGYSLVWLLTGAAAWGALRTATGSGLPGSPSAVAMFVAAGTAIAWLVYRLTRGWIALLVLLGVGAARGKLDRG